MSSTTDQNTSNSTESDNKHSDWNKTTDNRTSIDDIPQLEYDERDIQLIADQGK